MAAGVDHVRLLYAYLDAGELDGCASLTHTGNREDALRVLAALPPGTHELRTVEAGDQTVTATGRWTGPTGTVDFADVFTLSDCGLIDGHHRMLRAGTP
jgi:hypothetical protein